MGLYKRPGPPNSANEASQKSSLRANWSPIGGTLSIVCFCVCRDDGESGKHSELTIGTLGIDSIYHAEVPRRSVVMLTNLRFDSRIQEEAAAQDTASTACEVQ